MSKVPNIWSVSNLCTQIYWNVGSIILNYLYNALMSTSEKTLTKNKVVIALLDSFFPPERIISAQKITVLVKKNIVQTVSTESNKPSGWQFC